MANNFRATMTGLGSCESPRFRIPPKEKLQEIFTGYAVWDLAGVSQGFEHLEKMRPTRKAAIALSKAKPSMQEVLLIRDSFIPLEIQMQQFLDEDSEQFCNIDTDECLSAWPYSLKISYLCLKHGYGHYGDAMRLWVEQLQEGETKTKRAIILLNMARAFACSKAPVGYED